MTIKDDNEDINFVWSKLKEGFDLLFSNSKNISRNYYITLYNLVFNYCGSEIQDEASLVKEINDTGVTEYRPAFLLFKRVEQYLRDILASIKKVIDIDNNDILRLYAKKWADYNMSCLLLDRICGYLNRSHFKISRADASKQTHLYKLSVYEMCLSLWREEILDSSFRSKGIDIILQKIEQERNGQIIDAASIKDVLTCYVKLSHDSSNPANIYQDKFEQTFLSETERFYRLECERLLLPGKSFAEYIRIVACRIDEEYHRTKLCLHECSLEQAIKVLIKVFLIEKTERFCAEFKDFFDCQKQSVEMKEKVKQLRFLMTRMPFRVHGLKKHFAKSGPQTSVNYAGSYDSYELY